MKIYTLPLIISLFSLNIFADPPNDNFCLEQIEPSEHIQTSDRLTVVRNHKIDNLIIVGTPNWSQRVDMAAQDPIVEFLIAQQQHKLWSPQLLQIEQNLLFQNYFQ